MLSVDQPKFFSVVNEALAAYVKAPTPTELEAWWATCRMLSMGDVERALKAHADDADDGKRAPRPIDVKRRLRAGSADGEKCAARGAAGQCQYVGVFSEGTSGGGPFYCPWHRLDRSGPEAERWIQVSHDVPAEVAFGKRAERFLADAINTPSVVNTAHAIAKRHGDRPWQGSRFTAPAPAFNPDAEAP